MIKLQEKEPFFIGYFWFVIFTIFALANVYKLYIYIISTYQTVTIKKLISNNNNIINDERYDQYNPSLQFLDKTFRYGNNSNVYENNNVVEENNDQRDLPVNNNINETNINNGELKVNDINIQDYKNNSLNSKENINISTKE